MSKRFGLILFVLLALSLSACTRSASTSAGETATPKVNFPKPMATSGMSVIEIAGTQTAVATAGLPMPTSAGTTEAGTPGAATPTNGLPPFTPLPGAAQTTPNAGNTALPSPTPNAVVPTAVLSTPLPQATSAPVSNPGTYVLHEGEFLYCLARRFNVNPQDMMSLNGVGANQTLYAGTAISIPNTGNAFPGPRSILAHPTQYTVRAGDNIYSIACAFGDVDPLRIASANGLSGSYDLTAGATIQIP